jgi:hypothetical protein
MLNKRYRILPANRFLDLEYDVLKSKQQSPQSCVVNPWPFPEVDQELDRTSYHGNLVPDEAASTS